jgi:hypothetical protein
MTNMMLDAPALGDSVETWSAWLKEAEALPAEDRASPVVAFEIAHAKRWIPQREALEREARG